MQCLCPSAPIVVGWEANRTIVCAIDQIFQEDACSLFFNQA
ncbi:hypothetical protein SynBIOSE41_02042 [Synechococcus sp. BIOS-E4-1]|nr:hypothetical protein SynBIOSE41_02042 [Synechococcus sp. BIOS-E4-1]